MKTNSIVLAGILAISTLTSCDAQKNGKAKLTSQIDSVSYAIGADIGKNLKRSNLENVNLEVMMSAMKDAFKNDSLMLTDQQCQDIVTGYLQQQQNKKQSENVEKGKKFLQENAKKEGVTQLASGLQYSVIKMGTGPKPSTTDVVKTHYHGTLINGKVFDSSVDRGEPAVFPVNGVIKGWTEALQLMPVGSKWKLFIPSDLAYGERGAGGDIGPGETLVFEVELLSIEAAPKE
ncbi:MAG: FKBP-type peptidyl-prolyl cis-trans isomerase [Bacteroidota bacterium]|jgi:FKBP-type peptidyl-prolyl cis-trans isomerase FklB